jgi:sulfur-carrier protein
MRNSQSDMADTMASAPAEAIKVRLFAQLREQAGWDQRWLPINAIAPLPLSPATIWNHLALPAELSQVRIAINQQFAHPDSPLLPGDELAFLPPISGG